MRQELKVIADLKDFMNADGIVNASEVRRSFRERLPVSAFIS